MLFLLEFKVEYATGMSQEELFSIWSEQADVLLRTKKDGVVVDLWKCVGQRRVVAVVDVETPDELDQLLLGLPMMKKLGQHVHVEVTSLRRYEDFVADLKSRSC